MAKPKLTATLPDGTKATRRTDNAYTHIVAVQCDHAYDWAEASRLLERTKTQLADARARIAAGETGGYHCDEWTVEKLPGRIAKDEKKLAKLPTEGLYWVAASWHSRYDLAAKQRDVAYGWSHNGIVAGSATICEVDA